MLKFQWRQDVDAAPQVARFVFITVLAMTRNVEADQM